MARRHGLVPSDDVMRQFRASFSSRGSEDVALHMIFSFGIFEPVETPEDMALRNEGIRFLQILGGGRIDRATVAGLVKMLIKQPMKDKEK